LIDGARRLGIELSPAQIAQLDQLQAAMREWNQRVNLTRIIEPAEVEVKHYLDSLTAAIPLLTRLREQEPMRLIDVGTGPGFPGLPLKIAFPHLQLTLLEATKKKAAYLEYAVSMLGLSNTTVLAVRAEEAAADPAHRERYQWATARALGSLPVVIELCAPFLEPGGILVAPRRGDLERETMAVARTFTALKMWSRAPVPIELPGLEDDGRGLVVGEKFGPTPAKFPRRPGMAKKEPLV
jgi:16S rRNA (guanine527-N7)-methyltransferase